MKTITAMSILLLAVLSGCASPPPPGELILTEEDMRLKRRPFEPCPHEVTYRAERVTYYK